MQLDSVYADAFHALASAVTGTGGCALAILAVSLRARRSSASRLVVAAARAFAGAASRKPDLILLDAVLPGLDGWEVARELLADPATCEIPLVFLSAHADSSTRERALRLGALDYITKPFDPLSLPARIAELLA